MGSSHHAGGRTRGANRLEHYVIGLHESGGLDFCRREADRSDIFVGRKDAIVIDA
jgi:hypothetical protein